MKSKSYVPNLVGAEYMASIAHRYPYPFPPAIAKGPHPIVEGLPLPGGLAYTGRKARKMSENRSNKGVYDAKQLNSRP